MSIGMMSSGQVKIFGGGVGERVSEREAVL